MEIRIDPEQLQAAINTSATKAVADALGGYEVRTALGAAVSESVAHGVIGDALDKALAGLNGAGLAAVLAAEIQRATAAAVVEIVREGLVGVVSKLRGLSEYGEAAKAERARLKAELFNLAARVEAKESET